MNEFEAPKIIVTPPGPKAKAWLEREKKCFTGGERFLPFVPDEGRGCTLKDVDGNVYLDFIGSDYSLGHCPPEVVEAIKRQSEKLLLYISVAGAWDTYTIFAEKLKEIAPGPNLRDGKVVFCTSGSECTDYAMRFARYHNKRPIVITYQGDFHGLTPGALHVTTRNALIRARNVPMIGETVHIPYANCYRCVFGQEYPNCNLLCADYIDWVLTTVAPPDEVSAFMMESIQVPGGFNIPPKEYWPRIRKLCDKHGILMIDDEVITGMGRTGKWFGIEHFDVEPDIVCLGKSIMWGMPGAAFMLKNKVVQEYPAAAPGSAISSQSGNPVSCAAGIAGIELINKRNLLDNTTKMGDYFKKGLMDLASKHSLIGDVRVIGLLIGLELVKDRKTKQPATEEVVEVIHEAFKRGLIIARYGVWNQVLRMFPPLDLTQKHIDLALDILDKSFRAVEK